jgi:NhaP-type Na+/H+ or K+/H+ antiporter
VVPIITVTVLLSVIAHGISASPIGGRYAASRADAPEQAAAVE